MPTIAHCITQGLRRLRHTRSGLSLPPDTRLGRGVVLLPGYTAAGRGSIIVGARCVLEPGTVLDAFGGSIRIGHNVFVGPHSVIYGQGGVEIGDHCLVAMHCRILSSEHTIPMLNRRIRDQPDILMPTRLGRDVWLGAGVTVLGGVTIGDGCVVGAGSVVTKDLPAGSVCHGVPATVQRWRVGAGPH